MSESETDICVIGAGSAGLSVASGAVQMGARVVLIEGHKMGGDCLNYGCVPSKALIAAAGYDGRTSESKYLRAMAHVEEAINSIAPHDSVERFQGLGVDVRQGYARFTGPDRIEVNGDTIKARRFVIATGTSPIVPKIQGLDRVPFLTNETLFDLRKRPKHLLIIGGGPIGIEMAQAHRRLGCDVTVIEASKALGGEDPEIATVALDTLRREGVEIFEGVAIDSVSGTAGEITLHSKKGQEFHGTDLLVAVGRKVNTDGLGLDAAGVELAQNGIKTDRSLRTTSKKIYAIGDVIGGPQFTHVAGYHAGVVIRSIVLGLPSKAKAAHLPHVIYTRPEIAQIGLTESEARMKYGKRLTVVRANFTDTDRAIVEGHKEGLIKVMVLRGRPVGVSIVGPQAGELIGVWALAMANRLKMSAITATVLPYPTLGELNKRVAGTYFSPMIFENAALKRVVKWVQRNLP